MKENEEKATCQSCEKNEALEPHTCPYREEIHNNESKCNCCQDCEHECSMDI